MTAIYLKMKFFCLSLLLVFVHIRRIEGSGVRIPLTMYQGGDETDEELYGTISIGTPPQKFNALFKADFNGNHVLSSYCNSSVCRDQNHKTYNHQNSSTFRCNDNFDREIWRAVYGAPVTDTISIGNIQIQNASFYLTALSEDFDNKPYDVIVGLGTRNDIIEHCKKLGLEKKFSFYTNYPWDNGDNSELMLCGEDKTKFRGHLKYSTKAPETIGYGIAGNGVLLHDNDERAPTKFPGEVFNIDPSLSYIKVPKNYIEKIYEALNTTPSKHGQLMQVDCETIHTLPNITFRIADNDFTLTGNDYIKQMTQNGQRICVVRLIPYHRYEWVIGNVFTRKFFTVFDAEKGRVGFAEGIHVNRE